jgi:2-oxoglutarate ferredoxin oxidoreductase subunit delta
MQAAPVNKQSKGSKKRNRAKEAKASPKASQREQSDTKKVKYDQIIFRDWCKACGICIAFCPKNVIGRDETGAPFIEKPEECIGCRFCELHCPDFAITIQERKTEPEETKS